MTHGLNRRAVLACLAAAGGCTLPSAGQASGYPARGVRLLVGAPPGGPTDFMARIYADALGVQLGQGFAVENRPGASGTMAAEAVAKAPADGHTLLVSGPGAITTAPHLFKLGYDAANDFMPLNMLGAGAFVLVVHPSLDVENLPALIALARSRPGALAFGSGGNGSAGHLCTEYFAWTTGITMLHVPYKGDSQAVNDLLSGQIQMMFTSPNVAVPAARAGKLRALAVTTRERLASLPAVPTVSEGGFKDFEYLGWICAFAPAAIPVQVMDSLVQAWSRARITPMVRSRLDELTMQAPEGLVAGVPLDRFIRAESTRLGRLIRDQGIKSP